MLDMNVFLTIVGAAVGSGTIAVSVVLWISGKFIALEKISNERHLENVSRFSGIDLKLLRLEIRNERKDTEI